MSQVTLGSIGKCLPLLDKKLTGGKCLRWHLVQETFVLSGKVSGGKCSIEDKKAVVLGAIGLGGICAGAIGSRGENTSGKVDERPMS